MFQKRRFIKHLIKKKQKLEDAQQEYRKKVDLRRDSVTHSEVSYDAIHTGAIMTLKDLIEDLDPKGKIRTRLERRG